MLKTSLTRGLLLVLALALLGACSSSGVQNAPPVCKPVSDPCAPGGVPRAHPCNWPDYSPSINARQLLTEISNLVQVDFDAGRIDGDLKRRVDDAILRCSSPDLTNTAGRHVCDLQDPLPCVELRDIRDHAADAGYPPQPPPQPPEPPEPPVDGKVIPVTAAPASPSQHWETIATDLQGFPTGQ